MVLLKILELMQIAMIHLLLETSRHRVCVLMSMNESNIVGNITEVTSVYVDMTATDIVDDIGGLLSTNAHVNESISSENIMGALPDYAENEEICIV